MCPRIVECGVGEAISEPLGLGGPADCPLRLARVLDGWVCERYLDSHAAGRIRWDDEAGGACVIGVANADCDDLFGAPGIGLSPPVCREALTPLADEGARCSWAYECGPDATCGISAEPAPTCSARGDVGDGCNGDGDCLDSLHCAGEAYEAESGVAIDGACETARAAGGACESSTDCEAPLRCDPFEAVCFVTRGPGGPCGVDVQCAPGLYCDDDGTCGAPGGVGARCDAGVDCVTGLWCDISSSLCRAVVTEGEACPSEFACGAGLVCAAGLCSPPSEEARRSEDPPGGPGDACQRAGDCAAALVCAQGVCEALPGEGQPCVGEGSCAPLAYCDPASAQCEPWPAEAIACRDDADCPGQLRCHLQSFCTELPAPEGEADGVDPEGS